MASTTAMLTGLTGLNVNARNLDVIGNNIANVNTTAYKSNRMLFASSFSRNLSLGSLPGDVTGGTNPAQIGLGVQIAGTQRNFNGGALSATGDQRDLAIEGDGFFVVQRGADRFFTRAGAFRQNSANDLVTISGERVLGYAVDSQFNIVQGTAVPLNLPVGEMRLAEATENVRLTGNLNSGGLLPTRGATINFAALLTTAAGNPPAAGGDLLTAIDNPAIAGSQSLFTAGEQIRLSGVEKGGQTLPTESLTVTATTTVNDLLTFITQALGIQTPPAVPNNPDGSVPGVTIDAAGVVQIVGNIGTGNDINLQSGDLTRLDAAGTPVGGPPFTATTAARADGESVRHRFVSYDSLGTAVDVDVTVVLDSRTSTGSVWRYFIESGDATGVDLRAGTGTIAFDTAGRLVDSTPVGVTIDRSNTGADSPLSFNLEFASDSSSVTAFESPSGRSELAAVFQDGTFMGVLSSFSVGQDGTITGAFTNGLTRTIGQVALATFSNPEGLVDIGSNLFTVGPNSGTPVVTTPGSLGTGRIVGGALEQSNVDLAGEFINLIQASTGYSAASRIITTTDQLIQQLLTLGR